MESIPDEALTMRACVLHACCCSLLVCDLCTSQEVLVHTPDACRFRAGDRVCIEYSGAMTASIPPQISASNIQRLRCG